MRSRVASVGTIKSTLLMKVLIWFNWAINTQLEADLLILPHRGSTTSLTSLLGLWKMLCTHCTNATGFQFELSDFVRVVNEQRLSVVNNTLRTKVGGSMNRFVWLVQIIVPIFYYLYMFSRCIHLHYLIFTRYKGR